MKSTIARKIGFLLLMLNLTGVLALVTVSWLIEYRSPRYDLPAAAVRQERIARRLRGDLSSLSTRPYQSQAIRSGIDEFDAGLREIEDEAHLGTQPSTEPVVRRLDELKKRWSDVKIALFATLGDADKPQGEEAVKDVQAQVSRVIEASNQLASGAFVALTQERNQRIFYVLSVACILNACLYLLGLSITRLYIVRPVQLLDRALRSLNDGQLQEVPVVTNDEFANLTRTFNEMSGRIQSLLIEQSQAAAALVSSEARYRLLFESNPSPMWVYHKETLAILEVNQAAIDHYGYSRPEFLSKTILDIRPSEDVPALMEYIRRGEALSHGNVRRHKKRDGDIIYVRTASHDITFESHPAKLVVVDDISEEKRLEEQLRQSQKMEAIGQLSGGVAHDFNNILTVIFGHVGMLLQNDPNPEMRSGIEAIQTASERATGLTRQLLAFSRKQLLQPRIVNPNRVAKSAVEMITRLIGEHIKVRTSLSPDVAPVRVDPGQMEQVLMNLAINARDAMPNGGTLTIYTENARLDEHPELLKAGFQPLPYVLLGVEDTGCGMDNDTKTRIFEPFFTTKPRERGTGLGLSTVYGIVAQSGGFITVDSEVGRGTKFNIYLPGTDAVVEHAEAIPNKPKAGSETILLVEDEDIVREITAEGLKKRGYSVLSAKDGVAAGQICQEYCEPIHLLLTDVIMPEVNGAELARALTLIRKDIRVLFMSGYTHDALKDSGFTASAISFINKPFTFDQLHEKVRQTLGGVT